MKNGCVLFICAAVVFALFKEAIDAVSNIHDISAIIWIVILIIILAVLVIVPLVQAFKLPAELDPNDNPDEFNPSVKDGIGPEEVKANLSAETLAYYEKCYAVGDRIVEYCDKVMGDQEMFDTIMKIRGIEQIDSMEFGSYYPRIVYIVMQDLM